LASQAQGTKHLKGATEKLFHLLDENVGELLQDNSSVSAIAKSKDTSVIWNERMDESKKELHHLHHERGQYLEVANLAALIMHTMDEIAYLDPMYHWGLDYFIRNFRSYVQATPKQEDINVRVAELSHTIKENFFFHFVHGIQQQHRLAFAFIFITKLLVLQRKVHEKDASFLMKGTTTVARRISSNKVHKDNLARLGSFGQMPARRDSLSTGDQAHKARSRRKSSLLNLMTACNPDPAVFSDAGWMFLQEAELAIANMAGLCIDIEQPRSLGRLD